MTETKNKDCIGLLQGKCYLVGWELEFGGRESTRFYF